VYNDLDEHIDEHIDE
jgi:hypothetical protein